MRGKPSKSHCWRYGYKPPTEIKLSERQKVDLGVTKKETKCEKDNPRKPKR